MRKFYVLGFDRVGRASDFKIENLAVLLAPGWRTLSPPIGERGFRAYPEKPRIVIGKGRPPADFEQFHDYWLISGRLKSIFEAVDAQAFAFQACDVRLQSGAPGPIYWLCDVIRVLEAFEDETQQKIRRYLERTGERYYSLLGEKDLVFNERVIGASHIFRTPYSRASVFCDQNLKDACRAERIKGTKFHPCFG